MVFIGKNARINNINPTHLIKAKIRLNRLADSTPYKSTRNLIFYDSPGFFRYFNRFTSKVDYENRFIRILSKNDKIRAYQEV